jgi:glycine/D-amino acid oxidase-like deaminating enzyme
MSPRKLAIVGGGFSGLACALHATKPASCFSQITVFDEKSYDEPRGASSVAAGLLHPLSPRGKIIWSGLEGFDCAVRQIAEVEAASGTSVCDRGVRLIRPFYEAKQFANFAQAANERPEWVRMLTHSELEQLVHRSQNKTSPQRGEPMIKGSLLGACEIQNAIVVRSQSYLDGMWDTLRRSGSRSVQWDRRTLSQYHQLQQLSEEFDAVIVASGAGVASIWGEPLPLSLARGQNLIFENEQNLEYALLRGQYVVPTSDGKLICGATFEHDQNNLRAASDVTVADGLLREKLTSMYDPLEAMAPVAANAGVRVQPKATSAGKVPIVGQHPSLENVWLLTGLGSRGLIYHALCAEAVVGAAATNDSDRIPAEMRAALRR